MGKYAKTYATYELTDITHATIKLYTDDNDDATARLHILSWPHDQISQQYRDELPQYSCQIL